MTPKWISNFAAALLSSQIAFSPVARAAASQPTVAIQRSVANPEVVTTTVSTDVYRTESYQDSYTEQVPYQEEETYYENVPYQEKETYTDYEEYWETERQCRNETVYDDRCSMQRKCEPRFEPRCEIRRVCSLDRGSGVIGALLLLFSSDSAQARPREEGGNNRGPSDEERRREEERRRQEDDRRRQDEQNRQRERDEQNRRQREEQDRRQREENDRRQRDENDRRQREERDRQERDRQERERQERDRAERERRDREERDRRCRVQHCENVRVGETCRDERVCERVPRQETRCENRQVRRTRPVIRERWVTKYRQERRTRTVTRYREETRCCVTRQRQVFDHQYVAQVEVHFPAEAMLVAQESENFRVTLVDSDASASLRIEPTAAIYSYQPQIQKFSDKFVVHMDLVPTYQAVDLGEQTLGAFRLLTNGRGMQLSFVDQGLRPKLETLYHLSLVDAGTGVEIWSAEHNPQGLQKVGIELNAVLPVKKQVVLRMQVLRNGVVVSEPVNFLLEKPLVVEPEQTYDPAPYMDPGQVGKFSLGGSRSSLVVYMRDLTQDIPQVKTQYALRLSVMINGQQRILSDKVFAREALQLTSDGRLTLSAAQDFGLSAESLALLSSGRTLLIEGNVIRRGILFPGEAYAIPKKVTLGIP